MDYPKDINTVEWFFGYGGNHIGLKRVIPNLRLLAVCEIEAAAIDGILEKMEDGRIDPAPIWSDCKTFPTEPFTDRVDLFVASYPCQCFSTAGKRLGKDDPRHLWPYVLNFVRVVRPTQCFFENVEGHVTMGLSTVVSDLEELGYSVSWGIFSAAEVGAPHQRKRVFILGNSTGERSHRGSKDGLRQQPEVSWEGSEPAELANAESERTNGKGRDVRDEERRQGSALPRKPQWAGLGSEKLADPISGGMRRGWRSEECGNDGQWLQGDEGKRNELRGETQGCGGDAREELANTGLLRQEERKQQAAGTKQCCQELVYADGSGLQQLRGGGSDETEQHSAKWPSRPGEPQHDWEEPRTIDGKLNPNWCEQLMGLPVGWTGTGSRIDRLRLIGNGVVNQTAAKAWTVLMGMI